MVGSIFKWLFGRGDNGAETTKQLKNNIASLKQNQNLQQDQIKQLLKMNQLTAVETLRNRKLLKDLIKDMIQINFTVAQLEYQSQQLHTSVNFLNFMITVRHKITVIRDSTFAIQQNLNHLYIYLNTLSTHKLIPKMLTPYDLLALLKTVVKDLRSHPKLKLPVKPTKEEVYQYYQIMSASAVMYNEMLLCVLHIPLVDKSKAFQVFKIHNLPLPLPSLNKHMRHKLDHQYLAVATDKLYVTFPTAEEIFSCRMSIGSFCEINNAIYPTSAIRSCEYVLFMEQPALVKRTCKVDLVNFTRDQALSLDSQFWVILTVQPTTIQVNCLTKTYYVELQHPLDIIFLEESCEASTASMLLPSRTVLSKEVDSSQLGARQDQLKLHYQKIQDFTIIRNTPVEKLTPQQLESKASNIPEMENISLDEFNTTLTEINKEYPWQMPIWLNIIMTIVITIFITGIIVGCYICRVRGIRLERCLPKQDRYNTNYQNNSFKNSFRNSPSNRNLRPVHIEHPHLGEMMPLREIRPNSKTTEKKMTREAPQEGFDTIFGNPKNKHRKTTKATPDLVAEALSELSDLDFIKFYKKISDHAHWLQTTFEL